VYKYKCLGDDSLGTHEISVSAIQPTEIETIRIWRNQQKSILRQTVDISAKEQVMYYQESIWKFLDDPTPSEILLTVHKNMQLVAYGGLVHISWENLRAEISFLTDTNIKAESLEYEYLFGSFLKIIEQIANHKLSLHKLTLETYEIRKEHIKVIESAGYAREGSLTDHNLIDGVWVNSILHGKVIS
jgi:Acetyltransferase (GNAT) domain